jgi:hypothetical protein
VVVEVVLEIHLQDQDVEVNPEVQVVVGVKQITQHLKVILGQVILLQLLHHKGFQEEKEI